MRSTIAVLTTVALGVALTFAVTPLAAAAPPPDEPVVATPDSVPASDELPNPAEDKRRALREQAITGVLNGRLSTEERDGSTVVNLGSADAPAATNGRHRTPPRQGKDRYVEVSRETTDKIFVVLAEFGNQRNPNYPDQDTNSNIPGPITYDGPLHNQIPQPDRRVDNSTNWRQDYNRAYFQQLYFGTGPGVESLKTYYEKQSSGRYSVDGTVTDWVTVPYNQARYGRSDGYPCGSNVCSNTWALVRDAADQWYANQLAAGRPKADVISDLRSFDQWDRYDYDGDGNFNEPDGYIDHFQIVHAGGDQADGDPVFGEDAIWSHRWRTFQCSPCGADQGPAINRIGGNQIGDSGVWIADYTIQPENGGRSVFFHEYGHDLGLPDDYDIYGGDNANEYWTLMAQSRLGGKGEQSIGDRAGDLGAWNKLQLGWLDYEIVAGGQQRTYRLGPEEYNTAQAQGLVVVLPKKRVVTDVGSPFEGAFQWWSGTGDDLDSSMTRQVTLPSDAAQLSFQARWNIEDCGPDPCDYAYVEVDDGSGFTAIPGSITSAAEGNGIDGVSGAGHDGSWVPATFDLSAFAGKTIQLRVHYVTDGAVQGNVDTRPAGIFLDAVTITTGGQTLLSDGAENAPNGWALQGFSAVGASISHDYDNYYIAGYRTYVSFDQYLKTGPYNFGFPAKPDWVEHYPYQTGLLISYWDLSQTDNGVSQHPGEGRNLYIDARPTTLYRLDGNPWRTRVQIYDAPFSTRKADSFTLHFNGQASYIRGQNGQPLFDDTKNWFDPNVPEHGVKVRGAGVKIRVMSESGTSATVRVSWS